MRQPPYELQAGENRPETVLIPGPELLTMFPPLEPVTPGLQGNQQGMQLNPHPFPAGMCPVQAGENRPESVQIHGPEMSVAIFPSHEQVATGLHGTQQGMQLNPHPFPIGMCPVHQLHSGNGDDIPPPKADFSAPPPYDLATKLPTYEEVQREKTLQGEIPISRTNAHRPQALAFLAIDTETTDSDGENGLLGTDFMFFTAFFVAFLFNWIGFLLLMCFCHTVAARYGALSGFGLSLAKWTLIVKHSTELASNENSWLWWLIMAFGLLICVRAIIQYLNIKRGWRLLSGSAQERLLFFY